MSGSFGPELVLVVGHVPAAVQIGRREGGVAEHPPADEVVDALVGEQQPVRGLVGEAGEAGELRGP